MKLKPVKRHVDEIARDLFGPLLEDGFEHEGYRLVSWDAEQGLCLTFGRDDVLILIELEERNDELDCYARTERFNICARRQFEGDVDMTTDDRALADRVVVEVRAREARLPVFERPVTSRKRAIRELMVDRVLIPEGRNHYYLNPYVGCMIGCPYCYVKERADFSRHLEGLPRVPWGHYLDVKVNAADVLRQEVQRYTPGIVRMTPILTDPYQAIERHYRITRQCLEVFLTSGFAPAVLTRATRIKEDLELLNRFERVLVGFSIPTDMDRYRTIFEPGADPVQDRFEALKDFHKAGVPTVALIQPILPMNVDRVVDQVGPYVKAVRIDRMYFIHYVKELYRTHGLEKYAADTFFDETAHALKEGFGAQGVKIDDMDNLEPLVGRVS